MFKDILGQDLAVKILKSSLASGRISHAYLFYGQEGVGKRMTAIAFAQSLNCQTTVVGGQWLVNSEPHPTFFKDACGECISCRKIGEGNHPDVEYVTSPGRQIKIDQIRELKKRAYLKPMEATRKVYIIDDAGQMTREASNSLLKTLEEPPGFVVLILITSNINQLLPTIRSRCQLLYFHSLPREIVRRILCQNCRISPDRAAEGAIFSLGSVSQAMAYLEEDKVKDKDIENLTPSTLWEVSASLRDREVALKQLKRLLSKERWEFIHSPDTEKEKRLEAVLQTMDAVTRNANVEASLDILFLNLLEVEL